MIEWSDWALDGARSNQDTSQWYVYRARRSNEAWAYHTRQYSRTSYPEYVSNTSYFQASHSPSSQQLISSLNLFLEYGVDDCDFKDQLQNLRLGEQSSSQPAHTINPFVTKRSINPFVTTRSINPFRHQTNDSQGFLSYSSTAQPRLAREPSKRSQAHSNLPNNKVLTSKDDKKFFKAGAVSKAFWTQYDSQIHGHILNEIIRLSNVQNLVDELSSLCSQSPTSDFFREPHAHIKKILLPSIRLDMQSLAILNANEALLRLGHVYMISTQCLAVLRLASTGGESCSAKLTMLLVLGLDFPSESEYVRIKLGRCASRLYANAGLSHIPWDASQLNSPLNQVQLDPQPQDLQIFVDDFSKQFTQRYLHVYPEDPPYRYMSCEPGHGSYGTVTKVQSTLTNREFALKTFGKVFFPPDEERILDELAILEVCDHPNLLRLIDAYKIKDDRTKIHFVIEPWAPYTLDKFLYTTEDQRARECSWFKPGNRASTSVIFRVMHDLASGVRYLHERSIKHKDINPRNTLLYLEGSMEIRPILADVGKSKVHRKDGSTRYTDSTYEFLAPEQLDKLESTLQADIWQLGTCLAFLLVLACGGTAATHSVWHSVVNSADGRSCCIAMELDHFMAELEKFCDAQSKALGIVKRMLDKDPKSRSDIHEVLAALNNLVNVHDN